MQEFLVVPSSVKDELMRVSLPVFRRSYLMVLVLYFLSFLFIYAVKPVGVPSFSYLGILFIPVAALFSGQVFYSIKVIARNKVFWAVISVFYFYLLLSLSVIFFHGTGELSILKTIFHSVLSIPACMVIASVLYINKGCFGISNFLSFLGFLLKLQIFFIIVMIISPDVREFIYYLIRSDSQIERMSVYQGSRGLGVSGSVAFGLAVHLAINYFFYFCFRYMNNEGKFSWGDYVWMFFGAIALLSAGRTAILGIVALPFFVVIYNIQRRRFNPFSFVLRFCFLLLFFTAFGFILVSFLNDSVAFNRYVYYVMQPINLYLETGSFEVSSVKNLNDMYYYPGDKTLIFGDGMYVNSAGSYYGHTDGGYMRYVLFGGVFYQFLVIVLYSSLLWLLYQAFRGSLSGMIWVVFCLFFISLVFHYKGQFLMISVSLNKVYFIGIFYCILLSKDAMNKSLLFRPG